MTEISTPTYSICMCNYNMADTLPRSLCSILDQLDAHDYEVVVVDDGSSDNSVSVVKALQKQYNNLRLVELERDKRRKLGITRNISVQNAKGQYVLLHLDCDDIYAPFLKDFVAVFHQIEEACGKDVLVSGKHINMAKKHFLLEHGPYENRFRGEDRNLWIRLASINAHVLLDHVDFCTRLPKDKRKRYWRSFVHTWDHLVNDFRAEFGFKLWLKYEILYAYKTKLGWKLRVVRLAMAPFAYIVSRFMESHPTTPENMNTPAKIEQYRAENGGNLETILNRFGKKADWAVISSEGREIFDI
ncbi:MAG: glycosyltransferase [Alphaproteobacteria bacterium]